VIAELMALAAQSVTEERDVALERTTQPFTVAQVVELVPNGTSVSQVSIRVNWQGSLVWAEQVASYTPAVGHWVLVARHMDRLIILDRIIGGPPSA
jgi:hypothetical protein